MTKHCYSPFEHEGPVVPEGLLAWVSPSFLIPLSWTLPKQSRLKHEGGSRPSHFIHCPQRQNPFSHPWCFQKQRTTFPLSFQPALATCQGRRVVPVRRAQIISRLLTFCCWIEPALQVCDPSTEECPELGWVRLDKLVWSWTCLWSCNTLISQISVPALTLSVFRIIVLLCYYLVLQCQTCRHQES